jgi:hypothetical protein
MVSAILKSNKKSLPVDGVKRYLPFFLTGYLNKTPNLICFGNFFIYYIHRNGFYIFMPYILH